MLAGSVVRGEATATSDLDIVIFDQYIDSSYEIIPSILFGVVLNIEFRKDVEIIISTIPHYLIEFFAFCLFSAVLFELNRVIRVKIRNIFNKDKAEVSLTKKAVGIIKIYLVFILPMIIAAAFLETYIADIIFSLFQ